MIDVIHFVSLNCSEEIKSIQVIFSSLNLMVLCAVFHNIMEQKILIINFHVIRLNCCQFILAAIYQTFLDMPRQLYVANHYQALLRFYYDKLSIRQRKKQLCRKRHDLVHDKGKIYFFIFDRELCSRGPRSMIIEL